MTNAPTLSSHAPVSDCLIIQLSLTFFDFQPYIPVTEEPVHEKPIVAKDLRALIQNDPVVVGTGLSARQTTPLPSERNPPVVHQLAHSVTTDDVPLAEIRRQNDVERWRNKLRLEEKFQVRRIFFNHSYNFFQNLF